MDDVNVITKAVLRRHGHILNTIIKCKQSNAHAEEHNTVRVTKGGSDLPLYKVSVLLKTGGAGRFIITRKINVVIKAPFEQFDR